MIYGELSVGTAFYTCHEPLAMLVHLNMLLSQIGSWVKSHFYRGFMIIT